MPPLFKSAAARQDARVIGLVGFAHGTSHFFHLLLIPLFPWLMRDFGLSFDEWKRQVAIGVVAILITIPVVYGVQAFAVFLFWSARSEFRSWFVDLGVGIGQRSRRNAVHPVPSGTPQSAAVAEF